MLGAALLLPAAARAQDEAVVTSEEPPFIILGPYQIFLNSQTQIPTLDVSLSGGDAPINAPEGKNFLVLDLTFKNTGQETFKEIQLTVAFKDPQGVQLAMAPYSAQPEGTIKDKAPEPGKIATGKLIFEIPVGSSEVELVADGLKADNTLTGEVKRPVMGTNY